MKCDCVDQCARWSRRSSPDGDVVVFVPYVPACVDPDAPECAMIDPEFKVIDPQFKFNGDLQFKTRYDIHDHS